VSAPGWVVTIKNAHGWVGISLEITVRIDPIVGVESEDEAISKAMQEVRWFAPHLLEGPTIDSMRELGAIKAHRA